MSLSSYRIRQVLVPCNAIARRCSSTQSSGWWADAPPELPARRRIVVTGMGVVSPLGNSIDGYWDGLLAGRSVVRRLIPTADDRLQYSGPDDGREAWLAQNYPHAHLFTPALAAKLPCLIAGVVPGGSTSGVSGSDAREAPLFVEYAQHAATAAMAQAGILDKPLDTTAAVVFGSGVGNLEDIAGASRLLDQALYRRISPYFVGRILPSSASGWVGTQRSTSEATVPAGPLGGISGTVGACATGQLSVIQGVQMLLTDPTLNVVLAGASEAAIHPISMAGFSRMRALAVQYDDAPEKASRPFDKDRSGFVMGEGAGCLCLEDLDHARARQAPILAEVRGFGMSCDGFHMSQPREDGEGVLLSMKKALASGGVPASAVQHVSAHATSTPLGDAAESAAIQRLFGEACTEVAVSSVKGHMGHLLGAAGIVQAISSVQAIVTGVVPPTVNFQEASEGMDLNYVPQPETRQVDGVLSNSFGFGGINTTLLFSRPP